jgi:hypothetical protein
MPCVASDGTIAGFGVLMGVTGWALAGYMQPTDRLMVGAAVGAAAALATYAGEEESTHICELISAGSEWVSSYPLMAMTVWAAQSMLFNLAWSYGLSDLIQPFLDIVGVTNPADMPMVLLALAGVTTVATGGIIGWPLEVGLWISKGFAISEASTTVGRSLTGEDSIPCWEMSYTTQDCKISWGLPTAIWSAILVPLALPIHLWDAVYTLGKDGFKAGLPKFIFLPLTSARYMWIQIGNVMAGLGEFVAHVKQEPHDIVQSLFTDRTLKNGAGSSITAGQMVCGTPPITC